MKGKGAAGSGHARTQYEKGPPEEAETPKEALVAGTSVADTYIGGSFTKALQMSTSSLHTCKCVPGSQLQDQNSEANTSSQKLSRGPFSFVPPSWAEAH